MKYGYTCKCGWRLERKDRRGNAVTRRGYAAAKMDHAFKEGFTVIDGEPIKGCAHLRKELEDSRKVQAKG
jgi:hypothetical protein